MHSHRNLKIAGKLALMQSASCLFQQDKYIQYCVVQATFQLLDEKELMSIGKGLYIGGLELGR